MRGWKDRLVEGKISYMFLPVLLIKVETLNSDVRKFGVLATEDRVILKAVKQVLEPEVETDFHPYALW